MFFFFANVYYYKEKKVFLFLFSTFPVFYFLPFSSVCLSLHILYFLFLSFLSVFYFLSCCLLSFSSNFLCLPSNFSFCFYLFLCLLLSFFAFFYFHSLPVFYSIPLTPHFSFYPFAHLCVCFVVVIIIIIAIIIFILLFFSSVFSTYFLTLDFFLNCTWFLRNPWNNEFLRICSWNVLEFYISSFIKNSAYLFHDSSFWNWCLWVLVINYFMMMLKLS